jgi:histidyl-tRNA synthetase
MNNKQKQNKLKARLPRGLADRGPAEIAATRRMIETIREVYERYGFEPVETPAIEYTDALGKFLPDQDRPNEGVFSFQDDDEQWLSLRYDLTAPLARYVAEHFDALPKPYRSYREGYVFRNEKPGPGRFRQFMQFDADTVGTASMAADAENCMMMADTMEALGIPRGDYVVKVNNRKILDGVMETVDLGGEENVGKRLTVLRAIDKLDRLGDDGVRQLLGSGRKDESGDFTKGAGLTDDQIHEIMTLMGSQPDLGDHREVLADWELNDSIFVGGGVASDTEGQLYFNTATFAEPGSNRLAINNHATIKKLRAHFAGSDLTVQGLDELEIIADLAKSGKYGTKRIRIDPSVVRGLEYYTGPVYEAELTVDIRDDKGRPIRIGSVASGGRYDGLVSRFRGEPVPATGISIGVSRLLTGLTLLGKFSREPLPGPVVVTVFDKDRIGDYQRMVQRLRQANIRAELYLGNPKNFGNQLKYADRRGAPCVIIQGGDEKNDPAGSQVIVKDLILGAELAKLEKGREEYLQKQADAQRKVPEEQLVDAVREVLARHGIPG